MSLDRQHIQPLGRQAKEHSCTQATAPSQAPAPCQRCRCQAAQACHPRLCGTAACAVWPSAPSYTRRQPWRVPVLSAGQLPCADVHVLAAPASTQRCLSPPGRQDLPTVLLVCAAGRHPSHAGLGGMAIGCTPSNATAQVWRRAQHAAHRGPFRTSRRRQAWRWHGRAVLCSADGSQGQQPTRCSMCRAAQPTVPECQAGALAGRIQHPGSLRRLGADACRRRLQST